MRMKKSVLLFCIALALMLVLPFLLIQLRFQFLTPPGGLKNPLFLPKAQLWDIGQMKTLSAQSITAETGINEDIIFVYTYNTEEDSGRLAIYTDVPDNSQISCLTIYKPEWSGIDELYDAFQNGFEARLVNRTYIDWMEEYYFRTRLHDSDLEYDFLDSEYVDFSDPKELGDGLIYYFGRITAYERDESWYPMEQGIYITAVGNTKEAAGEEMADAIEYFERTLDRFWLRSSLGI